MHRENIQQCNQPVWLSNCRAYPHAQRIEQPTLSKAFPKCRVLHLEHWWSAGDLLLCASFTNFKNSKLEQTGTPLMGAMLTPMSGHTLFSSFKTKSSQYIELRVSLSSDIPVDAQWGDRAALAQGVSQHSVDSRGMSQLCACPPSPFPVLFQLSPTLLCALPQTVSACLVLTLFFLFARLSPLCSHIFP